MNRTDGLFPVSLLLLAGCGAGTAGLVAGGGGDSGGSSNALPVLSNFTVESPEVSPARVHFVLSDREGDPARVALAFSVGTKSAQLLTHIEGIAANPTQLASSEDGVVYDIPWHFTEEDGLSKDGSFVDGVRVTAVLENGVQELVLGANGDFGLGNDPPEIAVEPISGEFDGVVPIRFEVRDSSDDLVSIRAQFHVEGDPADEWHLARPAGLAQGTTTPDDAFVGQSAPRDGIELVFFWDTDTDLAELERDVRVRFTARDPIVPGSHVETDTFRIDNNAAPIAAINDAAWALNTDTQRGVRIPYRVLDEEHDAVTVAFQWRRHDQSFVELPADPAAIRAIIADPGLRAQHCVCKELPTYVGGVARAVDGSHVRLPELSSSEAGILAGGIVGCELELLRASRVPSPASSDWSANPLVHPVAALPLDDGTQALVLEAMANATWQLSKLDLASGVVIEASNGQRPIAAAVGQPSTMVFERGERSVLVASDVAGYWKLFRVELTSGAVTELAEARALAPDGPIRGLASLGTHAALASVGDALVRIGWTDDAPDAAVPLLTGLATPWGIVLDPRDPRRVYLAERDAVTASGIGRVRSVDLDVDVPLAVPAPNVPLLEDVFDLPIVRPTALAIDAGGAHLFLLTEREPESDSRELRELILSQERGNRVVQLVSGLPKSTASIAIGPESCSLLAASDERALWVGGGVLARSRIVNYAPELQQAALEEPVAAHLRALGRWRIQVPSQASSASGLADFVWDSGDLLEGGGVSLRAVPLDSEVGIASETAIAQNLAGRWGASTTALDSGIYSTCAVAADLDGDGDLDLCIGNEFNSKLSIFFQSDGRFSNPPLQIGGTTSSFGPQSIAAADLDGDGDVDLCSANAANDSLSVFRQFAPGVFSGPAQLHVPSVTSARPECVVAADLDGDGDADLCSANPSADSLTVFFQTSPGVFASTPLTLGSSALTDAPYSVVAADLDGDGDLDLCSANVVSGTLTIFHQVGAGRFSSEPTQLGGPSITPYRFHVSAADFDGDGDQDLCAGSNIAPLVVIYDQTSPGVFSDSPRIVVGDQTGLNLACLTAADVDADGDQDLCACSNGNDRAIAVFTQESTGQFSTVPQRFGNELITPEPHSIVVADLDADGAMDLCTANYGGGSTVFQHVAAGSFPAAPEVLGNALDTPSPNGVTIGDLDRDGDLDVGVATTASDSISIFFQTTPGVFSETPKQVVTSMASNGVWAVASGDLDGDGDLDLCATRATPNSLTIHFQTEVGVFDGAPLTLTSEAIDFPVAIIAHDLDDDGDLDICSANSLSNTLTIFYQSSPGQFSNTPAVLSNGSAMDRPLRLVAADLDGDGDQDLCCANQFSDNLTVFFQSPDASFVPMTLGNSTQTDYPSCVIAADLDSDGDMDLCSANAAGSNLAVFFQLDRGEFATPPLLLGDFQSLPFPSSVAAADVDSDGDLDLCAVNDYFKDNLLVVFEQTGPGVLSKTPRKLWGAPGSLAPTFVTGEDIDRDGDADLCTVHHSMNTVNIFWNSH